MIPSINHEVFKAFVSRFAQISRVLYPRGMYGSEDITNAFLDIDRADSVFELFFLFVRDDGTAVQDEQTFEGALSHIVGGAYIPEGALIRLRGIYDRTMESNPSLYDSSMRLKEEASRERPLLVMVFSVLLRLAMDEGMMCRRDRERLNEVFQVFSLTPKEIQLLPEELESNFECFIYSTSELQHDTPAASPLSEHFEALECTPESSSEEVRSSYRRLVKKYHPDTQSTSHPDIAAQRQQFEKVQTAYEALTRAKKVS